MAKIAFVQEEAYEKLSVMILCAVLKEKGHQVEVFISKLEEDLPDSIKKYKPDFISFSIYLGEERLTLRLLRKLKKVIPTAVVLLGGPLFLISQKLLEDDSVDIVFTGDGERNLPIVVDRLCQGIPLADIPGVSYKTNGEIRQSKGFMVTEDLSMLPMNDRDIYPSKYKSIGNQSTKYFIRSRGCPYKCKFCGNSYITNKYKSEGSGFRIDRNHAKLFNEIKYTKETYGLKWVQFVDGTFNASKEETKAFLREYAKAKMPPFICNIHIEGIDAELAELLKTAGCDRVTIGLQSAVPRIQKIAGRLTPNSKISEAVRLIQKCNIRIGIDMIIGWPGESIEDVWESIYFVRKLNPDYVSTNLLFLPPETDISKYAYENDFITKLPNVDDYSEKIVVKRDSASRLNVTNNITNMERLFEFAVYHPRLDVFVKFLAKTNWQRPINMINCFPPLRRSFQYDNLTFRLKVKKIRSFISL
jgi:Fe-S oxidoreductase